jgi:hypothetical protein
MEDEIGRECSMYGRECIYIFGRNKEARNKKTTRNTSALIEY